MPHKNLAIYMNDHLSGAMAALDLLQSLTKAYRGTSVEALSSELYAEVDQDRHALEELMDRFGVTKSAPRQATAWLGEKMARLKLVMDDPGAKTLRLLETTEAISLGVEGKRSMWRALNAAAETAPELRAADYPLLIKRAEDQRARVEALRLETATKALAGTEK